MMDRVVLNGSINPLDITNLNSTVINYQNPFVSANNNDSLKQEDTLANINPGEGEH